MKKTGLLVWRALVFVFRDMFIGYILGLGAAVIFTKINPGVGRVAGLLIPAGILAGIFKGIVKFVILNISSALPSKGLRYNYPKYKLLFFWLVFLAGTLIYGYGLNIYAWISGPVQLLKNNIILGQVNSFFWVVLTGLVLVTGLSAHFYEPPYNENEFLPPEPEEEMDSEENQ